MIELFNHGSVLFSIVETQGQEVLGFVLIIITKTYFFKHV
jgi:hypothetical protein